MLTIPLTYEEVRAAHPDYVKSAPTHYKTPPDKWRWGYGFHLSLTTCKHFDQRKTGKGKRNVLLDELARHGLSVSLTAHIGGGIVWYPFLARHDKQLPKAVESALLETDPLTWQYRRH